MIKRQKCSSQAHCPPYQGDTVCTIIQYTKHNNIAMGLNMKSMHGERMWWKLAIHVYLQISPATTHISSETFFDKISRWLPAISIEWRVNLYCVMNIAHVLYINESRIGKTLLELKTCKYVWLLWCVISMMFSKMLNSLCLLI